MDGLEIAQALEAQEKVASAQAALGMMLNYGPADERAQAKAFVELAFTMLRTNRNNDPWDALSRSSNPLLQKAATAAHTLGDNVWSATDAAALARAFVGSVAEDSLLDAIAPSATSLPQNLAHMIFASGWSASLVDEGHAKAVRRVPAALLGADVQKAAAIVVMSRDLAEAIGGQALFERELRKSVVRATNSAVLSALQTTSTHAVATTGDPLNDLRAGLNASEPSDAYVVAVSTKIGNNLATRIENRGGASVRGGEFVPGVHLVTVDELTGLVVIPASRVGLEDGGLRVAASDVASVEMSDSPSSPSSSVSLFTTNSAAILCERQFRLICSANLVTVS